MSLNNIQTNQHSPHYGNHFQYSYKQNEKKIVNNSLQQLSPRVNQMEIKIGNNDTKPQFLPIERIKSQFTRVNSGSQINSIKSTIFTQNRNLKNNFQPGTLASMARVISQNKNTEFQVNHQKVKMHNFLQNHLKQPTLQKSHIPLPKYTKPSEQKPNVYRSFINPSGKIQRTHEFIKENIQKKHQVQNIISPKSKEESQYTFFNKYSADQNKLIDQKSKQQIQRLSEFRKQVQYSKSPNQKLNRQHASEKFHKKKEFTSNLIIIQEKKTDNQIDMQQQLKKFKEEHFSTSTIDTPVKQKKFFKPVFFKNKNLQTNSDNKIINLEKFIASEFASQKNSYKYINIKHANSIIMSQRFELDECKGFIKQWSMDDFEIGDKLGKGAFGDVFIAKEKISGFVCVIKKMSKKRIKQQQREEHVLRELKIQSYLAHRNLAALYGYFHDKEHFYLIIEYLPDGNLSQMKKNRKTSQKQAAGILRQLCEGLSHMHNLQIIHRDIKPENIFVNENFMKIGDFGCSVFTDKLRKTIVSCLEYSSPQQLNNEYYNQKIDVWGIGILAYELLTGKCPFQTQLMNKLRENDSIDFGCLKYPDNVNISDLAKDFIAGLLDTDPLQRLNIYEALEHQFIQSHTASAKIQSSSTSLITQIENVLRR